MRALPQQLTESIERGGQGLKLLVLRFGALGDLLRTLPVVRLLHRGLPQAHISWALDQQWAHVLDNHPDLDEIIPFPRPHWNRLARSPLSWPRVPPALLDWRRRLRAAGAGLVLDFHGNLRSGLSGLLSGTAVRLGYEGHQQKEGNRWFTTHRVAAGDRRTPRIERNLDLVRALGLPDAPLPDGGLVIPQQALRTARDITGQLSSGPYAVIAPGASLRQAHKKPGPELLAAAAQRLGKHGITSMVVYGPGEETDAQCVVEASSGAARLAAPTDLHVLAALLNESRLFVGGDSGPLHLACAVRCPVVGLYGPPDPKVNGPWGVPHVVVVPARRRYTGIKRRDRRGGFDGLTAEMVESAVDRVLTRAWPELSLHQHTPGAK